MRLDDVERMIAHVDSCSVWFPRSSWLGSGKRGSKVGKSDAGLRWALSKK
jgi:hypothetical protein